MLLTKHEKMTTFLSTFEYKVDTKGRVSVPSQYRDSLKSENKSDFSGAILYQSIKNGCIEGSDMNRIQKMSEIIDEMEDTPEKDVYAQVILGGASQLPFDSDGRIVLPENLRRFAEITDRAVFIGKGQVFEIWEPKKFEEHNKKAIEQFKTIKSFPMKKGQQTIGN
jgi:MraZ protein